MRRTLLLVENGSVPTDPRVWPECIALRDAGWHVSVVCPRGRERETAAFESLDGIEVHRFQPAESTGGARGYVAEYGVALRETFRILRRISAHHDFDVVHAATPPDFLLLAARSLRGSGAAFILDHHDLSPELFDVKYGRRHFVRRSLLLSERLGFHLAHVVISPNESFRRVAILRGRKAPEDVFVVRNGPDPSVFRPVSPDPSLALGAPHLIGYVGRMGTQDGVLEALDTLEHLLDVRGDWHAIFAGDGEVLEQARKRVSTGRLATHVTFPGFISERARVVQILSSCDVCISPEPPNPLNDSSTFIKVAEYMAVGRAIVSFDLRETAKTAGPAAVRVGDSRAFARALSDLLDDPPRRARMGEEGRARVTQQLGWSRSVATLLAAYDRALSLA